MAAAALAAALFPPQNRDWALPAEANVSPHAAERICREAATRSFDEAAKSLNHDWRTGLDGKQVQRWGQALGRGMVSARDRQSQEHREGRYVPGPPNPPQLLVIGLDGGRYQGKDKDPDTDSRWREDKVVSISSYIPGDGTEGEKARKPKPLVTTHVATARDAHAVGVMARVEAERRGYRQAQVVIGMGDGGTGSIRCLTGSFPSTSGSSTGVMPASIYGTAPRPCTGRRRLRRRRWPSAWRHCCGMAKSSGSLSN